MVVSTKPQAVWEADTLTLVCKAGGAETPLSVSWWYVPQNQTKPKLVASMGQDGTVQLGTSSGDPGYHRNTRLEKVDWATFRLEITSTMVTDSGTYECRVSERLWNGATDRHWTQKIPVTIKSLSKCQRNPFLNLYISRFILRFNLIVSS